LFVLKIIINAKKNKKQKTKNKKQKKIYHCNADSALLACTAIRNWMRE
jgi:hypothetical protein